MNQKSFTLIEVMVAIFIITVGAGAAFALIRQTLFATSLLQDRLIAAYLAQEGIEIVKNIRDTNWLKKRSDFTIPWNNGFTNCQTPTGCEGDYNAQSLVPYQDRNLYIDSDGFYSYSPGVLTKFKRKISIDEISSEKMRVLVEVKWTERGRTHSFEALEHITNWHE